MVSGGMVQALVAFGANLILVRLLTPEDFGRYAIVLSNVNLMGAIVSFRVPPLVLRDSKDELDEYLAGYTTILIVETFIVATGAVVLLAIFGLLDWKSLFILGSSLLSTWVLVQTRLYERSFEYRRISIVESGSHIAGHLFAVVGAFLGMGALVLYLRAALNQLIRLGGLAWFGGLSRLPVRWLSLEEWRSFLQRIRGLWTDGALEQSFERAVIVVVGALAGERVTGFFFQARRLAIIPHQLLQPVTDRIIYNHFSHQLHPDKRFRGLLQIVGGLGSVLAIGAIGAHQFANPIIPWLFGEQWAPVVPLFIAMLGVIIAMSLFNILKTFYMAEDRMQPFIYAGRGGQYGALLVAAGGALILPFDTGRMLAFGLSSSYVIGTLLALWVTYKLYGSAHTRQTIRRLP